jgi:hypothetical protein
MLKIRKREATALEYRKLKDYSPFKFRRQLSKTANFS